jgi:hypothetical protein
VKTFCKTTCGKTYAIYPLAFLVLVFTANAALFNSTVYYRVLQPKSSAGRAYYFSTAEKARPFNPDKDILVLGDSRIESGFSAEISSRVSTGSNFINAGLAGTAPRVWYYLLREIDPDALRYKAVVLTVSSFSDRNTFNDNNRDDVRYLAPLTGFSDISDISLSYDSNLFKVENAFNLCLKGFALKGDVTEFLHDPIKRLEIVGQYDIVKERREFTGKAADLRGLSIDVHTNRILFPKGISEQERLYISNDFSNPFDKILPYNIRYNRTWLKKIIEYYRDSDTLIFLVKIPCVPLFTGKQNLKPEESSSLLELAREHADTVILVKDTVFDYLEKPEYFADHVHLNRTGRELFSNSLASSVAHSLQSLSPRKQQRRPLQ